jgi:hypothetical protein
MYLEVCEMEEGSFFLGISDIIKRVKGPDDLLMLIGLMLFGVGVYKENALFGYGTASLMASGALKCFSKSKSKICAASSSGGQVEEYSETKWGYMAGGLILSIGSIIMIYCQITHKWLLFHK